MLKLSYKHFQLKLNQILFLWFHLFFFVSFPTKFRISQFCRNKIWQTQSKTLMSFCTYLKIGRISTCNLHVHTNDNNIWDSLFENHEKSNSFLTAVCKSVEMSPTFICDRQIGRQISGSITYVVWWQLIVQILISFYAFCFQNNENKLPKHWRNLEH